MMSPRARSLTSRLGGLWRSLYQQLAKFGVVGLIAFTVDVGLFNVFSYAGDDPLLDGHPIQAKIASTAVATVVSWLGNRYWTFRHTRRPNAPHELALFVLTCTLGLGITLVILWVSRDLLGLDSPLEVNIAANGVGLVAATAFRFWTYQRFVFTHQREVPMSATEAVADEVAHHGDHPVQSGR
ncbi:GtrA family protein [Nakamurella flavida]|uniref:GtrA family protein n=1 Tax=Nakamurella flavida TaxID=363630 RepID=A0A939C6Q0_9ACTN|nr:GtrA family protein [Nakamurella flavida]MBM9478349.1 GtrA family protein [Nakamurella flavida]MDP9777479.1 putative flippase GtrA [Nakamurella flavida]